jgi:hypothetical protein
MNADNLRALANVIERLEHDNNVNRSKPYGFCLDYLEYNCGSPSCIAGWACALKLGVTQIPPNANIEREAAEWMDMPHAWLRDNVFYPTGLLRWPGGKGEEHDYHSFCEVTPQRAARVLRTLADAGENYTQLNMKAVWSA